MATTDLNTIIGQEVRHLTISDGRLVVETAQGTVTAQWTPEKLLVTVDE